MPGIAAEHEALRRVAALVARGARHTELFAVAGQELAQLVQADAAALLRFEPDETITLLAAWNATGAPAPVGDREPVNAALRRLRDTARPMRCGPEISRSPDHSAPTPAPWHPHCGRNTDPG